MSEVLDGLNLGQLLTAERLITIVRAVITFVIGLLLARVVSSAIARALRLRVNAHESMLIKRLSFYVLFALVVTTTLHQLGFQLGVLLGAAGILTVALGFAAQTSVSNLICGLFLVAERPFVVGDQLEINGTVGMVLSVDLLSTKLRTFDNLMVRVPNETMIRTTVVNRTRFPIRRLDVQVNVAYKESTERVRALLLEVADRNPLCLDEPKPLFIYKGYGSSALELQFSIWAKRENFLTLRNGIHEEIKAAFDENGIEIPFPHRTLYAGSVTEPFPIRVVEQHPDSESSA